ncbi:ESX secretion-associated protein EspG [Saccharothrix isguenensis]
MTVATSQRYISLSVAAYLAAWEHLELGPMPIVLHVNGDEVDRSVGRKELTDLGVIAEGGLVSWLTAALELVADPPCSVDLRLGIGRSSVRALAASAPEDRGVLAILRGGLLAIIEFPDRRPAAHLVELVPPYEVDGVHLRGWFGASFVDTTGRRHRVRDVVDFRDTPAGRLLGCGEPAGPGDLLRHVEALLEQRRYEH